MDTAVEKIYTLEEYLEMEYHSDTRHYFYDGIVKPMTYTSEEHGLIVANVIGELHIVMKDTEFRVYPSDRMLYVPQCRLNYYPDVMVVKGEPVFKKHTEKMHATLNPYVLFEVLSESTEANDKLHKWRCYRQISSLRQYIIIDQDQVYLDIYNRIDDTSKWENDFIDDPKEYLTIAGFDIEVNEIYRNVKFTEGEHKG